MAQNSHTTCAFSLIALIMFATAKPLAHGLLNPVAGLLDPVAGLLNQAGGRIGDNLASLVNGLVGRGLINAGNAANIGITLLGGLISGRPVSITSVPEPALNILSPVVQGLNIEGELCCTATGNCPPTGGQQPLSVALVNFNCTSNQFAGGSLVLGQGRTDVNGYFNISVANMVNINIIPKLFPVIPCNITVQLDQAVCPILSSVDGILVTVLTAVVRPLSLVLNSVLGLILHIRAGLFVRV